MEFTHFDEQGNARMVDVTAKGETVREAVAKGRIRVSEECFGKIKEGTMAKGDVLGVARIAGIMGAKRTSELIPLCHILNLTKLNVDFNLHPETCEIEAVCTAKTTETFCEAGAFCRRKLPRCRQLLQCAVVSLR